LNTVEAAGVVNVVRNVAGAVKNVAGGVNAAVVNVAGAVNVVVVCADLATLKRAMLLLLLQLRPRLRLLPGTLLLKMALGRPVP